MHGDQTLENNGPCRVPEAVLQSSENLTNASLAGMRGDKNMLDIFRLRGSSLKTAGQSVLMADSMAVFLFQNFSLAFILVAPLTDFSKELDIVARRFRGSRGSRGSDECLGVEERASERSDQKDQEDQRDQKGQEGQEGLYRSLAFALQPSLHRLRRWAMG